MNEPAFPVPSEIVPDGNGGWIDTRSYGAEPKPGMSLRDWLAGLAMQSLLAMQIPNRGPLMLAGDAYEMADAMLELRKTLPSEADAWPS